MSDTGVFNRLAAALPMDDRKNLLEKLRLQADSANQPLYDDGDSPGSGDNAADLKKKYAALPWYSRLFFWFSGLFRGKTPLQMYLNQQLARLGRLIAEQSPGIYDHEHDLLLGAFYQRVSGLKESARFFYDALDMSVNRDKGAFYVFLASLEIEDIHRRLLNETDPEKLAERHPGADDAALRQMALEAMDEGIASIGDDRRSVMYHNARILHCLKELSAFLFDRLLVSFSNRNARKELACSAHLVNNYLRNLNNILYALKDAPPMTLLESLFIFILQDKAGTPEFNMENEMKALLAQAQQALAVIRTFNKTVPLNKILRCAEKDMSILPNPVSGGEDWFSLYKEYWKYAVEKQFNDFIRKRRLRELMKDFQDFFKTEVLAGVPELEAPVPGWPAAETPASAKLPLKGAFCFAFLRAFHSTMFLRELEPALRPLLIAGKFAKRETDEFTGAYQELSGINESIRALEGDFSTEGELGKRYAAAQTDMSSLSVKRYKLQLVENEAAEEEAKIINRIRDSLIRMVRILGGILPEFPGVNIPIKTLTRALELMDKIAIMEDGR
ncbi:hypothetical protein AGMMS4952_04980 [Spirochaetia bacterium]|nr:hypothetical protein AGMMS4952_04980 [Spirochaetia bacterium]